MYKVSVFDSFSSAHYLRNYNGKCEAMHGHNWKIQVTFKDQNNDKNGMVIDFTLIKKKLSVILGNLDHKILNDIIYFKEINPTAENISKFIYDELFKFDKRINSVRVWENEKQFAEYST